MHVLRCSEIVSFSFNLTEQYPYGLWFEKLSSLATVTYKKQSACQNALDLVNLKELHRAPHTAESIHYFWEFADRIKWSC